MLEILGRLGIPAALAGITLPIAKELGVDWPAWLILAIAYVTWLVVVNLFPTVVEELGGL